MMNRKNTSGNVLFIILIAVALFGALSYAVTQSGRGGGTVDKEKIRLQVSEIIQYATSLQTAVHRVRFVNGCALEDISFHADWDNDGSIEPYTNDHYNAGAPAECHIFDPAGGGLTFTHKYHGFESSDFLRDYRIFGRLGVMGLGDEDLSELAFVFRLTPTADHLEFCNTANNMMDIDVSNVDDSYNGQYMTPYTGSFDSVTSSASRVGDGNTAFAGKQTACFNATGYDGGGYIFYHVLAVQ